MKFEQFFLWIWLSLSVILLGNVDNVDLPNDDSLKRQSLPPCQSCKAVVESFNKGMERTARGKFEGGDADWEEKKLGSYVNSEVRLVEIQEGLCRDLTRGQDQCHTFVDQHDHLIEEWWFKKQKSEPDLHKFLCIESVKVCCPDKHYGPECKPCIGYPDNVCSNNGKCKGNGTRKGNGKCACDSGYTGEFCNECASGYFQVYKDDKKLICDKCHTSCQSECTESGPRGCKECAKGWYKTEKGCMDVNECLSGVQICTPKQFCVNKEGSYQCLECDPSCDECTGDGPDMCVKCASGYTMDNNFCVDTTNKNRKSYVNLTRYLTYFGLCLATCIIFQRNMLVASIIGLVVGIYITVSEYMLANQEQKTNTPIDLNSIPELFK